MARAALEEGIDTVVATPHVDLTYGLGPEEIARGVEAMRLALSDAQVPLTVLGGAEVALTRCASLTDEELRALCLGSSSCVLVESPYTRVGDLIEKAFFDLQVRGFRPLLAHPERCPEFQHELSRLERLVERGALCSVSAGSMIGQFGRTAQRSACRLLAEELVHDVSSDAHDAEKRPPAIRVAFRGVRSSRAGIASLERWLTRAAPAAILADEQLAARPAAPARPRWRRRGAR